MQTNKLHNHINNIADPNKREETEETNDFTKGVTSRHAVTTRTRSSDRTGEVDTKDPFLLPFLFDGLFYLLLLQKECKKTVQET